MLQMPDEAEIMQQGYSYQGIIRYNDGQSREQIPACLYPELSYASYPGAWGRAPQIYSVRLVCSKNNACVTLRGSIVFFGNSKRTLYAQDQIQIVERKLSKQMFVRVNARFSTLNVHLLLQTCVYFVNSPNKFQHSSGNHDIICHTLKCIVSL